MRAYVYIYICISGLIPSDVSKIDIYFISFFLFLVFNGISVSSGVA